MSGTGEDDRKDKSERREKTKKAGSWEKRSAKKIETVSEQQTDRESTEHCAQIGQQTFTSELSWAPNAYLTPS